MTYTVSSGTLNSTIHTYIHKIWRETSKGNMPQMFIFLSTSP